MYGAQQHPQMQLLFLLQEITQLRILTAMVVLQPLLQQVLQRIHLLLL